MLPHDGFVLAHRPLTEIAALLLNEELKKTANTSGYTVRELTCLTDVFVAEVNGLFAGVGLSGDLVQN